MTSSRSARVPSTVTNLATVETAASGAARRFATRYFFEAGGAAP
jgi:hypothetical protein